MNEERAGQKFVAISISRRTVSEEINSMLGMDEDNSMGRENRDRSMTPLTPDDERLTDAVCEHFAKGMGAILEDAAVDGWSESHYFEAWAEYVQDFAEDELGLRFEP